MNEVLPADSGATGGGLAALRRFAAPQSAASSPAVERCEMCGEELGREHPHLVDLRKRSLGCACQACALLFSRPGAAYRTVPDRVLIDPDAPLTEAEWTQLRIPVSIAFFFTNSDLGRVVASYPSPAGVTECELDLGDWDRLVEEHPLLREPEDDVEAILVVSGDAPGAASDAVNNKDASNSEGAEDTEGGGIETFLVPIDVCYSLAGALRIDWHGFDGGEEVRKILASLLASLRERARPLASTPG